jgi:hypothetical protein
MEEEEIRRGRGRAMEFRNNTVGSRVPQRSGQYEFRNQEVDIQIPQGVESTNSGRYEVTEFRKGRSYRIREGRKLRIGRKLREITEFWREQESRNVREMRNIFSEDLGGDLFGRIFRIRALKNLIQQ